MLVPMSGLVLLTRPAILLEGRGGLLDFLRFGGIFAPLHSCEEDYDLTKAVGKIRMSQDADANA